jgi:hypothetical protein
MAAWRDIRESGRLLHDPRFCTPEEADALFAWRRDDIPWRQETVHANPLPRLNA